HRALPAFPTRRSSDLAVEQGAGRAGHGLGLHPEREVRGRDLALERAFREPVLQRAAAARRSTTAFTARVTSDSMARMVAAANAPDRKSTRLNSSHVKI